MIRYRRHLVSAEMSLWYTVRAGAIGRYPALLRSSARFVDADDAVRSLDLPIPEIIVDVPSATPSATPDHARRFSALVPYASRAPSGR